MVKKADRLLRDWKSGNIHPEERWEEVKTLLRQLGFEYKLHKSSHAKISHKKLESIDHPHLDINHGFTIPVKSGRKVKKIYIKKLLKILEIMGF